MRRFLPLSIQFFLVPEVFTFGKGLCVATNRHVAHSETVTGYMRVRESAVSALLSLVLGCALDAFVSVFVTS